jgi:NAD-dependent SIR2 family protein deacetylase
LSASGTTPEIERAAELIAEADALLITAGAGMSVDSGLPDFRGPRGFWRAYPPLERLGLSFEAMAQPRWFHERPSMAWGFYGHRLALYRTTRPHPGYALLRAWCTAAPAGGFVFTSNVDGHFSAAGFPEERLVEHHGSVHRWQCSTPCSPALWPAPESELEIDMEVLEVRGALPRCPRCGAIARPNVLMFNDFDWIDTATRRQHERYAAWLRTIDGRRLTIVECGAGTAVATVRIEGERIARRFGGALVRINPEAFAGDGSTVPIADRTFPALQRIAAVLERKPRADIRTS